MNDAADKIHVVPLAGDWEIETEGGQPLAHEENRERAVAVAREMAQEQGADAVVVHESDGLTEVVNPQDSRFGAPEKENPIPPAR